MTRLKKIPLDLIRSTAQNPRSKVPVPSGGKVPGPSGSDLAEDDDLRGLAASLGDEKTPQLVEPPTVEEISPNEYRILAGERRIQAARLAGWQTIACLVHPVLDPAQAHTLRLVENLHRRELHPLDQAAALKIAWLSANADAIGLQAQGRNILGIEQAPSQTLTALQILLKENEFSLTHPAVTWDALLDRLGVEMSVTRRKRLLSVLGVDTSIQERVRELDISEASLRALGQMEAEAQAQLVEAIEAEPELAQKVRRIAHAVNHHDYELEDALQEAQGQVAFADDAFATQESIEGDDLPETPKNEVQEINADVLMDRVVALMEIADQIGGIIVNLNQIAPEGDWGELPDPWGEYAQEAHQKIKMAIEKGNQHVL